jgi:hypothetical protein
LATVTWAHYSLIQGNKSETIKALILTIILSLIFTGFQGFEYFYAPFTFADGVFGSVFYFGTGLIYGAPIKLNTKNIKYLTKFKLSSNSIKLKNYWVTGFSDAESTFSVRILKDQSRLLGIRIIPVFSIELHIRDIETLKKIKNFFNVGSIIVRIRKSKQTGIYSVQSLNDLTQVIIPHFNKYPLLTQKQADFILFSSVVNIMLNKEHLTEKGIYKILSIRASMNKGLTNNLKINFPNIIGVKKPIINNQIIKSSLWLVGFVDGEGCFYLKITKNKQINLVFSISQHSRDLNLFNVIKNYLDCGIIEKITTRPNTINFVVYKFEDILKKILPIFEEYSLITKKYLDFIYFKEVSSLILNKEHLTKKGIYKILLIKNLKNKN